VPQAPDDAGAVQLPTPWSHHDHALLFLEFTRCARSPLRPNIHTLDSRTRPRRSMCYSILLRSADGVGEQYMICRTTYRPREPEGTHRPPRREYRRDSSPWG
jgi:hypothetical protein